MEPLEKGDRLPSVGLREWSGNEEIRIRPSRGPRVVVTIHQPDCAECVSYVKEIASTREALESWGADVLVISAETMPTSDPGFARLGVRVLEDPRHVVADGRLTVIIADEWGEVYFASQPDTTHGRVAPEEVVEWVKFIAIQCPECEGPEGDWLNL